MIDQLSLVLLNQVSLLSADSDGHKTAASRGHFFRPQNIDPWCVSPFKAVHGLYDKCERWWWPDWGSNRVVMGMFSCIICKLTGNYSEKHPRWVLISFSLPPRVKKTSRKTEPHCSMGCQLMKIDITDQNQKKWTVINTLEAKSFPTSRLSPPAQPMPPHHGFKPCDSWPWGFSTCLRNKDMFLCGTKK